MAADRQALSRLRVQARQARTEGHFLQAARLEQQAVELANLLGMIAERTRALLWQGYSLHRAGEDDLALAALLQVANERGSSADPADSFAALIAVIRISLDRKSLTFCRTLVDQGRRYLADLQQPWAASLDYLEGELAYRQNDLAKAWKAYSYAWAHWHDQHPHLTAATHLWALCRVAFRRRDWEALQACIAQLSALDPVGALDRQLCWRAQLLGWRAHRTTTNTALTPVTDAKAAGIARALLAEAGTGAAGGARRDTGACREAQRVLSRITGMHYL